MTPDNARKTDASPRSAVWRGQATWGMVVGLVTALVTLLLLRSPLGAMLEYDTLDAWFALRRPLSPSPVAMLAIDEPTIRRWGGRTFDHAEVGRLLHALHDAGARS